MKITFLGTGTSQGIPIIACECDVCRSTDPKDKRLRSSVLIESDETAIVIDTGPDFRQQMLREQVKKLDAVVFTHGHKDHTAGFDDIRGFNWKTKQPMDVYANADVEKVLRNDFHYAFAANKYPGVPNLNLRKIGTQPFAVGDMELTPIEVLHYRLPVLGFRVRNFTYITDANYVSEEEKEKIFGTKILVLNALRKTDHISHFTLSQAIDLATEMKAEQTYFTHFSHQMGKHLDVSQELPEGMYMAYDGLSITL